MSQGRRKKSSAEANKPSGVSTARGSSKSGVPFAYKLVLNQWVLAQFGVQRFDELAESLRDEAQEGIDEEGLHRFCHILSSRLTPQSRLTREGLLEHDQAIVRHTHSLNDSRRVHGAEPIVWKYFQYLALLFTEIYLDRYFRDPARLLIEINEQVSAYNNEKPDAEQLELFDAASDAWPQLNKLAFWMATGSGKTLLMHVNILQYKHALETNGRSRELNRIILLTPNEGLSKQHLRDFRSSGIHAKGFDKDGPGLLKDAVEVLEITRLRDEMGEKTVAVDAFEGNNLVLVDEGHRGASGGEEGAWMRYRNALCEKGFSFEYSATFGQAVKGKPKLVGLYARSVLCDYSYRYFYRDGFGKDYQILNLDQDTQRDHREVYMVAGLLSFYQQQKLYRDQGASFRAFNIEKPLWVFVGGSVTATLAARDGSDVVEILQFLSRYIGDRAGSVARIRKVLSEGLVTANGRNLFAERFRYLNSCGLSADQVFDDTLQALFNAPAGGQLYVENLKGAAGEVALRLGAGNEAFGVINVGDDAKLVDLCRRSGLATGEREFSGSLFHDIDKPHSAVNLLIGSKKFTEGWSSWRVSTMGLMNVGRGEGSQIIQLFGRGVRLKGYEKRLRRSAKAVLPAGFARPKNIAILETLGIFGIHADYMAQFRDFIEEEGLAPNDDRTEFLLPVLNNLGDAKLKTVRLKKTINGIGTEFGDAFRKLGPVPTVSSPDLTDPNEEKQLHQGRLVLNWYPKIQSKESVEGSEVEVATHESHLTSLHVACLNLDKIYFELERYRVERGWHNLNLTRCAIEDLLSSHTWYKLQIPESELAFESTGADSFGRKVRLWEEIAISLLKKYTERYYSYRKHEWEMPHLEYRDLGADDPNFLGTKESPGGCYRILVDASRDDVISKLEELKLAISRKQAARLDFQGIKTVNFEKHLYQPLLYIDSNIAEVSPVPLNKGEKAFVEDLQRFYQRESEHFKDRELYLLRNLSKGRGVGFFEAGNFYPDFILWIVEGKNQRVVFIDPKGIRNLGRNDPKIQFYRTIKEIEQRIGDPNVRLDSFIVSNTDSGTMQSLWGCVKEDMKRSHVLFMEEDKGTYISEILRKAD